MQLIMFSLFDLPEVDGIEEAGLFFDDECFSPEEFEDLRGSVIHDLSSFFVVSSL